MKKIELIISLCVIIGFAAYLPKSSEKMIQTGSNYSGPHWYGGAMSLEARQAFEKLEKKIVKTSDEKGYYIIPCH